jgi:hypothetical protein
MPILRLARFYFSGLVRRCDTPPKVQLH